MRMRDRGCIGFLARWCHPIAQPHRSTGCSLPLENIPVERPDIAIYSQEELWVMGYAHSWLSPDIQTYRGGPGGHQSQLLESVVARIRNISAKAGAIDALVHCYTSVFGIGMPRTLLSSQVVSVPASAEVSLQFPLSQEILSGEQRIGAHIEIEHPHDTNYLNNRGSQTAYVVGSTSQIGSDFQIDFPVFNESPVDREINLSFLQNPFGSAINPSSYTLEPQEQVPVKILCHIPDGMLGTPSGLGFHRVTVIGKDGEGNLIDGFTVVVIVDIQEEE